MTQLRELKQTEARSGAYWAVPKIGAVATILSLAQLAHAAETTLRNKQGIRPSSTPAMVLMRSGRRTVLRSTLELLCEWITTGSPQATIHNTRSASPHSTMLSDMDMKRLSSAAGSHPGPTCLM